MAGMPKLPSAGSFNPGLNSLKGAGRSVTPSFNARISFKGLDELARDLDAVSGANLELLVRPVMKEVAESVRDDIAAEAPEKTGNLKSSFEVDMHRDGIGFDIISKTVYHGVVNWGWKAKGIRARRFSRRPVRKAFGVTSRKMLEEMITKRIGRSGL